MRPLPESSRRGDWPRLVAQKLNSLQNLVSDTIAGIASSVTTTTLTADSADLDAADIEAVTAVTALFTPSAEPGSPVEGLTYMDSTTHKLRTYDGTAWQDHW